MRKSILIIFHIVFWLVIWSLNYSFSFVSPNPITLSNTLIKAGEMLTDKMQMVQDSPMGPEIKIMTLENIRKVWDKTKIRIKKNGKS